MHKEIKDMLKLPMMEVKKNLRSDIRRSKDEPVQPMGRWAEKVSFFHSIEGCNEARFIAFDASMNRTKYTNHPVPDIGIGQGRDKLSSLNPAPLDQLPDYDVPLSNEKLRKGSIIFNK